MDTPAAVQTTPPELLGEIFSHACTDGGYTGYSLNLVCKTFHEICLDSSLDIQSAAVCGTRKMVLFLEMLRRRAETKRIVVSLFLTHRESDGQEDAGVPDQSVQVTVAREVAIVELMSAILETVSSKHLRILHADYRWHRILSPSAQPLVLPGLVELSLSGQVFARSLSDVYVTRGIQRLYIRGPALTCRDHGEGRGESFGDMLSRDCPLLSHLRIAPHIQPALADCQLQFVHSYCELTRSLRAIVKPHQAQVEGGSVQHFAVPARLRRIIVDSPPEHRVVPHFDSDLFPDMFNSTRTRLHRGYCSVALEAKSASAIEEEDSVGKKSLRILPLLPEVPVENKRQYELEKFGRMKAEWLERTAGTGPGCWI